MRKEYPTNGSCMPVKAFLSSSAILAQSHVLQTILSQVLNG